MSDEEGRTPDQGDTTSDAEKPTSQDEIEAENAVRQLEKQFEQTSRVGYNYVAKPAPGFDVHGLWHTFSAHDRTGYASHAMSLHWMLDRILGIPTQLVPHRHKDVDIEHLPHDRYDTLFAWVKEAVGIPAALICSYPPEVAAVMEGAAPNVVPYCAFEAVPISAAVVEMCNNPDLFTSIWTVSDFSRWTFTGSGVEEARVQTVRPVLCGGPWPMRSWSAIAEMKRQRPVSEEDPYIIGALGSWHKRKGMHDLIRAYFNEFRRDEPVKLRIRTSAFGEKLTIREMKEYLTEQIAEIAKEFGDDNFPESKKMPRLGLDLGTDLTDEEVIDWLAWLDGYANASYGEGLGIPHIWARAHGVPMVTSDWGAVGQLVCESKGAYDSVFDSYRTPAGHEMLTAGLMFNERTSWGGYELDDLSTALRRMVSHGRVVDGDVAESMRKTFGPEESIATLVPALQSILDDESCKRWNIG